MMAPACHTIPSVATPALAAPNLSAAIAAAPQATGPNAAGNHFASLVTPTINSTCSLTVISDGASSPSLSCCGMGMFPQAQYLNNCSYCAPAGSYECCSAATSFMCKLADTDCCGTGLCCNKHTQTCCGNKLCCDSANGKQCCDAELCCDVRGGQSCCNKKCCSNTQVSEPSELWVREAERSIDDAGRRHRNLRLH